MNKALTWVLDRLKEKSTWVGLIGVLSSIGVGIKPELAESISVAGVGLIGLVLVITKEKKAVS